MKFKYCFAFERNIVGENKLENVRAKFRIAIERLNVIMR